MHELRQHLLISLNHLDILLRLRVKHNPWLCLLQDLRLLPRLLWLLRRRLLAHVVIQVELFDLLVELLAIFLVEALNNLLLEVLVALEQESFNVEVELLQDLVHIGGDLGLLRIWLRLWLRLLRLRLP